MIYYKVGDTTAVYAALEARHVRFEATPHLIAKMPDHELWLAFLWGNAVLRSPGLRGILRVLTSPIQVCNSLISECQQNST